MNHHKLNPFPCNSCGKCCRSIGKNDLLASFNRGDGICKFLEEKNNTCLIYKDRPLVCNIEEFYKHYLSHSMSWNQFVQINLETCKKL